MNRLQVRHLDETHVEAYVRVLNDSFLGQISSTGLHRERRAFQARAEEHYGVFDGADLIGVTAAPTTSMTLPGGVTAPVSAVTSVAVSPSHRRRGAFAALVRQHLAELTENGPAISALWPSQGALYARFGYAPATRQGLLVVDHGAPFHSHVRPAAGGIRELPRSEAMEAVRKLHDQVAPQRVGWIQRDEGHWALWLEEPVERTEEPGPGSLRFAVHDGGYLAYRVEPKVTPRGRSHQLHIRDLVALDPGIYAALWRHILDLDLSGSVHYALSSSDEPLLHMLADPRAAEQSLRDGMWVRLADVPGALIQRRYRDQLDLTMSLTDVLCPNNAGTWRLTVDAAGIATVTRTGDTPQMSLGVAELAATYLGATSWVALAAAGRIHAADSRVLEAADRAFGNSAAAHCSIVF